MICVCLWQQLAKYIHFLNHLSKLHPTPRRLEAIPAVWGESVQHVKAQYIEKVNQAGLVHKQLCAFLVLYVAGRRDARKHRANSQI